MECIQSRGAEIFCQRGGSIEVSPYSDSIDKVWVNRVFHASVYIQDVNKHDTTSQGKIIY